MKLLFLSLPFLLNRSTANALSKSNSIAVGEPNGGKGAVDFSLNGYFFEGANKIAAYRIHFHGVHFPKEEKKEEEIVDEVTAKTDGPLEEDGRKSTRAVDGNGGKEETNVNDDSFTTRAVESNDEDEKKTTEKKEEKDSSSSGESTSVRRDDPLPSVSPPSLLGEVSFTGIPPKPEFGPGKCTDSFVFSFNAKAGRCLAKKISVCSEEDWERVTKESFGVCMRNAPRVTPADNNVKSDCRVGKVYAKVPGLCRDEFCPKEATCVQEKTAAHCCILPRLAHYG